MTTRLTIHFRASHRAMVRVRTGVLFLTGAWLACARPADPAPAAAPQPAAASSASTAAATPNPPAPGADGGAPAREPGDPRPPGAPRPNTLAPDPITGPLQRPPHPTMATSAHGLAALQELAARVPVPAGPVTMDGAVALLGSMEDGSEVRARDAFVHLYRTAPDNEVKGDAVGGVILALVLDPSPEGYRARLTDAYGMSLYVTAFDTGKARLPEAARVVVNAAAARARDALEAANRIMKVENKDAWLRLSEGVARAMLVQRGAALDALDASASAGKAPARTYAERARLWMSIGETASAVADAETARKLSPSCSRCAVLRAQAMALSRDDKQSRDGITALAQLTAGTLSEPVLVDALVTAALAESRLGGAAAAETIAGRLRGMKAWAPEAALASGLAASAAGDHGGALLALERAVKDLPPGLFRAHALIATARSAMAEKAWGRALQALDQLDTDLGPGAERADMAATLAAAMGDAAREKEMRLLAHALDPYDAARAEAAGRKPRAGGAAASARMEQAWRMVGAQVPRPAIAVLDAAARADARNPSIGWARVMLHRLLDASLPPGSTPADHQARAAAEAIAACGKEPPSAVLPLAARKLVLTALDEGARDLTLAGIKRIAETEPDPALKKQAQEAAARKAPAVPPYIKGDAHGPGDGH